MVSSSENDNSNGTFEVAKWVFHLSVISSAITILSVPYNAAIIANERMGAFAAISIIETLLKLCVAIFISFCNGDRLLWYAGLLLGVSVIVRTIYGVYCSKSFPEAKLIFPRNNKLLYKEMTSFAGWSLVGNLSVVGYTQGINLLLNIFLVLRLMLLEELLYKYKMQYMDLLEVFKLRLILK